MFAVFLGWLFLIFWCFAICYFVYAAFVLIWAIMDTVVDIMEFNEYERMGNEV